MNKSESIKELATALAQAQAEMPSAPFNAVNPFLKNKYADLGSIIATSRPVLAKYGLSVSQLANSDNDNVGVTTILMHKSGEWISDTMTLATGSEKGKSNAQVAGSIITYLRRYSLASILGMYSDEDTDGNEPQPQRQRKAKPDAEPLLDVVYPDWVKSIETSNGEAYVQLPTEKLSHMANSIQKVIDEGKANGEHETKLKAIKFILKARADAQQQALV